MPFTALSQSNEAPCSKLQGIKRNCAEANPPSLYELRRGRLAIHPCSPDLTGSTLRFDKLQGILAKANKPQSAKQKVGVYLPMSGVNVPQSFA